MLLPNNSDVVGTIVNRNSSIEVLRIISMIMIIIFHKRFYGDAGGSWAYSENFFTQFFYLLNCIGGFIADNLFILISGYFLIDTSRISIDRIIKVWGQVFFYSVILYLLASALGICDAFSLKTLITYCLPVTFNRYWFASCYLLLYVIHPFLNIFLRSLGRRTYLTLLSIIISIWCIMPSLTMHPYESNHLIWFIVLYSVAGYIRLFGIRINLNFSKCILIGVMLYIMSAVFVTIAGPIAVRFIHDDVFYVQNLAVFAPSVFIFMAFVYLKPTYNRIVNIVASATFGVYLIHIHPVFMVFFLRFFSLPPIILLVAVYIGCTVIELLRQFIIEKPFLKLVGKLNLKPIIIAQSSSE